MTNPLDAPLELNHYLLLADPYRFTVPILENGRESITLLRFDHPLQAQFLKQFPKIHQLVDQVTSNHGITVERVWLYEYSSLLDHIGPKRHPLVSVHAKVADEDRLNGETESWQKAADELHANLHSMDLGSPFVEILCWKRVWQLTIGAILKDQTEVKECWERAKPDILKALESNFCIHDAQWSNICVFMCPKRHSETDSPTVVVRMVYPSKANWFGVTEAIKNVLKSHKADFMDVEFAYGGLKFSYRTTDNLLDRSDIYEDTEGGNSLGAVNHTESGSVGGCIVLQDSDYRSRLCLLTCHHVVRPANPYHLPEDFRELPLQPKDSNDSTLPVMRSPSVKDHEATYSHLKDSVALLERQIQDRIEHQQLLDKDDSAKKREISRCEKVIGELKNHLAHDREVLEILEKQAEPIGKVIASSGIQVAGFYEGGPVEIKRKMDWAIVEIQDEARFNPIYAPQPRKLLHRKSDPPEDGPYDPPWFTEPFVETAPLEAGQWVCMRGRTSGYTTGRVNLIPMESRAFEIDIGPFQEMIIISTRKMERFATEGDRGAFIYDRKGRVVAMQVSESFPESQFGQHHTGAVPIRSVFVDIARRTKAIPRLCSMEFYLSLFLKASER